MEDDGSKLKGFLKLPAEEREEYDNNPNLLAEEYRKDHPCVLKRSLQVFIRMLITDFSN
jgi:hypothetical protein